MFFNVIKCGTKEWIFFRLLNLWWKINLEKKNYHSGHDLLKSKALKSLHSDLWCAGDIYRLAVVAGLEVVELQLVIIKGFTGFCSSGLYMASNYKSSMPARTCAFVRVLPYLCVYRILFCAEVLISVCNYVCVYTKWLSVLQVLVAVHD